MGNNKAIKIIDGAMSGFVKCATPQGTRKVREQQQRKQRELAEQGLKIGKAFVQEDGKTKKYFCIVDLRTGQVVRLLNRCYI
jgi:fructose-1,6-bisphosphatase/sedoheptulose 1,7-bisphosphatase-like protein